jgi:hypothetical protein
MATTELTQAIYTAFQGPHRLATGELSNVAVMVKEHFSDQPVEGVLIFDDATSQLIDVDFRGTIDDVRNRIPPQDEKLAAIEVAPAPDGDAPRGPGRPKLGVVAREVTLLPRHWDWLNTQTGGASVVLRKLVEEARRASVGRDRIRLAQEASYRFMSAALSGESSFEEAARALFAGNQSNFHTIIETWPVDLRDYLKKLSGNAFDETPGEASDRN